MLFLGFLVKVSLNRRVVRVSFSLKHYGQGPLLLTVLSPPSLMYNMVFYALFKCPFYVVKLLAVKLNDV